MSARICQFGDRFAFQCPGCECLHQFGANWTWNGSFDRPTVSPSILVQCGHYATGHKGPCWCTFEGSSGFKCFRCHSFIADGKIRFLGDCTHRLAGQTVELPDWDSA